MTTPKNTRKEEIAVLRAWLQAAVTEHGGKRVLKELGHALEKSDKGLDAFVGASVLGVVEGL